MIIGELTFTHTSFSRITSAGDHKKTCKSSTTDFDTKINLFPLFILATVIVVALFYTFKFFIEP
jgi:hypothetical protein